MKWPLDMVSKHVLLYLCLPDYMSIFSNSNTRGTSRERALLMMFERYYMTVNEIHFPIPTGKLNSSTKRFYENVDCVVTLHPILIYFRIS